MERADKDSEIQFLTDCFEKANIALCADYRGLTVAQLTKLRRGLRENGAQGRVVKNTLLRLSARRALAGDSEECEGKEVNSFLETFQGPSLLIYSFDEPIAATKLVSEFGKAHEHLEIKGGWFEGKFVNLESVKALADMPGREELYAKLLSVISAPATQLVRLLAAPATQMAQVIDAHRRENLEGGAG